MDDSVSFESTSSTGHRESLIRSEYLKTNIYFPVLDHILSEIDHGFTQTNLDLMKSLQACHPSSYNFLESSQLVHLVSLYNLNTDLLATECTLVPTIKKILQIGLTLALSTAQCERSFSTLKRIKTYLRLTMTEKRLTDIALLSIESDLGETICLDDVVTEFEGKDKNRTMMLS